MKSELRKYFITGLLVSIPVFVTLYALWFAFSALDGILRPLVSLLLGGAPPGLSLAITVLLILLIGFVATVAAGKEVIDFFEKHLLKIPIVSAIYSISKEVSGIFLTGRKGEFNKVVLVEFPSKGLYSIGFTSAVSIEKVTEKTAQKTINVLIPTTPNPTTGFLIMVPEDSVIPLDISVEDAFKIILSGGFLVPKKAEK